MDDNVTVVSLDKDAPLSETLKTLKEAGVPLQIVAEILLRISSEESDVDGDTRGDDHSLDSIDSLLKAMRNLDKLQCQCKNCKAQRAYDMIKRSFDTNLPIKTMATVFEKLKTEDKPIKRALKELKTEYPEKVAAFKDFYFV